VPTFILNEDSTMLVNANHIKLTLNGRAILQDVSVHIEQSEIYGLLGPNGAGKSTSIAVLLGLYEPDEGDVRLFDETHGDPLALRRRIGVMPEHAGFYEWMSARDYLAWYASFYGGLQQPVADLLHLVGLRDSAGKPIGQFSRGMQQRLALARALVDGPELLILDEPTNGLDPRGRREIHDLLLELAGERRVGILLCTHLLDDVERLCNRIGVIDGGRTLVEGSLRELATLRAAGRRFRLRLERPPADPSSLPPGVTLTSKTRGWWRCLIAADNSTPLPTLWEDMLVGHGWDIAEIHAEGGGLEGLYLELTGATEGELKEEAA
jgi:ABC-2 type transport system ATP-binding protein